MWNNFGEQLYDNIIAKQRYLMYLEGYKNTLIMTFTAAIIGVVIGAVVAICKVYIKNAGLTGSIKFKDMLKSPKLFLLKIVDAVLEIYLGVIRGTPLMVQLLLFCYVIFVPDMSMTLPVATLALGINSGAYVAEIVRAGIQAVNIGQTEAGRSLGLTNNMTMRLIVLPQAIKNILPALANEAIVLLKETSIVGYIAVTDIIHSGTLIRSRTYSIVPILFTALVYLITVVVFTMLLRKFERRLAKSDKNG